MGAAFRALVGLALVGLTACGTTVESIKAVGTFVPWLPLPPAHQSLDATSLMASPAAVPNVAARGVAAELEGVGLAAGVAAGNVDAPLLLRNKGTVGCYLRGFVDVT